MAKRSTQKSSGNGKVTNKELLERLVHNTREIFNATAISRQAFINKFLDPRRDIGDEAGYPATGTLNALEYKEMYDREAIAARVVEVLPMESWKVQPSVFETEDVDQETKFESAWKELGDGLRGESWYNDDEQGNPIWESLERVDILSGIGAFGVILLGLDDGKDLPEPAEFGRDHSLMFVRELDESLVQITQFEEDVNNPRFGLPNQYSVKFSDPREDQLGGAGVNTTEKTVHWTRIVHIADNLRSSEVFGVPRMRPVFNRLMDIQKVHAGSAEMYWRGAFPGLSWESHPQLGGDLGLDADQKKDLRDQLEQYQNTLQRVLLSTGMTVKSLAPQVVDPTPQIDTYIESICIKMAIPKRIFTGSERGELASSQDAKNWDGRMAHRENNYITPRVIVPFVDRLILLGALPEPQEGYNVVWPDLGALTEDERATIAVKKTEAMAKYIQGSVESLIEPLDYLTRVIGMTEEEAMEVVEAAIAKIEEDVAAGVLMDPAEEVDAERELKEANLQSAKQQPETGE